jgi:endonuclease YncB( thermonuclease family)
MPSEGTAVPNGARGAVLQATRMAAMLMALLCTCSMASPIDPGDIQITDGDTIRVGPVRIRLVGFDAPEFGGHARCDRELELADRAGPAPNGQDGAITEGRAACCGPRARMLPLS